MNKTNDKAVIAQEPNPIFKIFSAVSYLAIAGLIMAQLFFSINLGFEVTSLVTIEFIGLSFFFALPKISPYKARWRRILVVLVYGLIFGAVIWSLAGFVAYIIFVISSVAKYIEVQDEKSIAQLVGYLLTLFGVGFLIAIGLFIIGIQDAQLLQYSIWLASYFVIRAGWDLYGMFAGLLKFAVSIS